MSRSQSQDRTSLHAETKRIEALGLWRSVLARLRGEQTLRRLRKQGLRAHPPLRLAGAGAIDDGFAWAIEIGAHSIIASGVRIIAHDAAIKRLTGYTEVRPVVIGERCYIGAGAIVLPGAVIGDDAIIGAGALVRGEVPAGSVAVGNPARVVGTIEDLNERHISLMASTPQFDVFPAELKASGLIEMRRELEEHGRVYVL
jgi:hypothetical protein